jgi:prepilin-type N-terminal cleavage/methylation domain-containing protein
MEKNCKNKSNKKGFTLIELLVVISIIGLLSSIVIASLTSARKKAEAAKIVQEMNQLKVAFELYKTDHGVYPNEGVDGAQYNGIDYLKNVLVPGKYIPSVSKPPSQHYLFPDGTPYVTGSSLYGENDFNLFCGGKPMRSYFLEFYYDGMDLNFPKAGYSSWSIYMEKESILGTGEEDHWYCIGE